MLKVSVMENHDHVYNIAPEIEVFGSGFQTLVGSELEISLFEDVKAYHQYFMIKDMYSDQWSGPPFFESEISSDTVITLKLLGHISR